MHLLERFRLLTSAATRRWLREERTCLKELMMLYKEISVKFWITSKRHRCVTNCAAAALMFVLWVGTLLLAASPDLHRRLHSDSQTPDHHCLITQLKEHSVLSSAAVVSAPAPAPSALSTVLLAEFQFLPTCDHRLAFGRAPPSVCSSTTVGG